MNNYILRPVFNRPEMLQLSIEYEVKAREYHKFSSDLVTLFLVEYGATNKVLELVASYPYKYEVINRTERTGLSKNMLEGMKVAFSKSDNFVIIIEDDILLHYTYFKFIDKVLSHKQLTQWSVISAFNHEDVGSPSDVRKDHNYASLAPLINKWFHTKYILPASIDAYYDSPKEFSAEMDAKYAGFYHNHTYKFSEPTKHCQQAGLINRLVDIASIEEDVWVIAPSINRQQHIGFYGVNRPYGSLPGETYEDRLSNLRVIIQDTDKLYELADKRYNDYKLFSTELKYWDGEVKFIS